MEFNLSKEKNEDIKGARNSENVEESLEYIVLEARRLFRLVYYGK